MSAKAVRWLLWLGLVVALPLPFYLVETGAVPALRLALLTGVVLAVIAVEGAQGAVAIAALLLGLQLLVYLLALWVVAGALARVLAALSPRTRAVLAAGLVLLGLAAAAIFPIYTTPFRTEALRGRLLEVLE